MIQGVTVICSLIVVYDQVYLSVDFMVNFAIKFLC